MFFFLCVTSLSPTPQVLRCENIIVELAGKCRISDIWFSKIIADIEDFEEVYANTREAGSTFFSAPEVTTRSRRAKHDYDEKVDIWSLGCVVTEMWVSRRGRSPWGVIEASAASLGVCHIESASRTVDSLSFL